MEELQSISVPDPTKTSFFKYFINIYKNASFLIIEGIIIALYLTASSVFANQLNLSNLTYFNSMFTVVSLATIMGFSFASSMGIYINQNFKNKAQKDKYIKLGFIISIIVSTLLTLFLVVFKNFVVETFLGISVDSYTFYYTMVFVCFLSFINYYLRHILKNLKQFKIQILLSIIYGSLLILGFALLVLTNGLALNFIGALYVAITIINFIIVYTAFLKSKHIKLNLFKLKGVKITKEEALTTFYISFSELVWQVGYMLVALTLLKVSELYFNAYAYYENVLDIFNTFFFSFIVITSIEVTRDLGSNNLDRAYKHGVYSILSVIIIWAFYAVISMVLFVPINAGLNTQVQSVGLVSMILYVLLHLPRFLAWNFSTYLLPSGGKVKTIFILEVLSTAYIITIFLLAPYLPQNIYLIYFLIGLDNIIKLPIFFAMFKSKNGW